MASYRIILIVSLIFIFLGSNATAKTDLSISETDITFSKEDIIEGEKIKVYARVFNIGDTDVLGFVRFLDGDKEIADPQPISLKPNTYDDVFVDWEPTSGDYKIGAGIIGMNNTDEDIENNTTFKENVFVDVDTDKDGIGDQKDDDIDGDGLSNQEEAESGTDSKKTDTDGDGVGDKIDAFPLDSSESQDTDKDGIGDKKDDDIDGDGLSNQEEITKYGTNPFNNDTDGDSVSDLQEIQNNTDPNKQDKTSSGSIIETVKEIADSEEISKWKNLVITSVQSVTGKEPNKIYLYAGIGLVAFIILIFMFKIFKRSKNKKRK